MCLNKIKCKKHLLCLLSVIFKAMDENRDVVLAGLLHKTTTILIRYGGGGGGIVQNCSCEEDVCYYTKARKLCVYV